MASVTLEGPFELTADAIDAVITEKSPGSFILGVIAEDSTFTPLRVGRADQDVRRELVLQLRLKSKYNGFKFRYAATPHEAFDQQCQDFHACDGCEALENRHHPTRPSHTNWLCPVCNDRFLD